MLENRCHNAEYGILYYAKLKDTYVRESTGQKDEEFCKKTTDSNVYHVWINDKARYSIIVGEFECNAIVLDEKLEYPVPVTSFLGEDCTLCYEVIGAPNHFHTAIDKFKPLTYYYYDKETLEQVLEYFQNRSYAWLPQEVK